MDIGQEFKDRIIAAASAIFEENGHAEFPTVAAVRKRAGVDMNMASAVMKEWRRSQTAQAAPVAVEIPEKVRAASQQAVAALWAEAQALANESLLTAQAAWDAERTEAESLRAELAEAFDAQRAELEAAQAQIAEQAATIAQLTEQLGQRQQEAEALRHEAETQAARASEIERRAGELRAELDRAHADIEVERTRTAGELDRLNADLRKAEQSVATITAKADAEREAHAEQRKTAATEAHRVAERLAKIEGERDNARKEAGQAREEAAKANGELEAAKAHAADLAGIVKSMAKPAPAEKPIKDGK